MTLAELVISCSVLGFSRLRTRRALGITRKRFDRISAQLPPLPWHARPPGACCDLDAQIRSCCELGYSQRMTRIELKISRYKLDLLLGAMEPLPWGNPWESPAVLAASRRNVVFARAARHGHASKTSINKEIQK